MRAVCASPPVWDMYRSKSSLRPASSSWSISAGRYSTQDVETSTTPGSATAATNLCSNANARGTQYPAWLMP